MTSEKITMFRTNADKTETIEQLPKTIDSQVYDSVNEQFLDETLEVITEQLEQTTTQLVEIDNRLSIDIRKFGAKGNAKYKNGGVWYQDSNYTIVANDDTQAFIDVIAYVKALPMQTDVNIDIPAGSFLITSEVVIEAIKNLCFVGKSPSATKITYDGAGSMFHIGTYTSTPTNYWQGTSQGFEMKNLHLFSNQNPMASTGTRTRVALQDNGCGSVKLRNVKIEGFKIGFNGIYGSDFSTIIDCEIIRCDIGTYLGPGAQQVHIQRVNYSLNRESIVMERADQGSIENCWFTDGYVADIVVEANSTLRTSINPLLGGTGTDLSWEVRNCWFETGAGWNTNADLQYHIVTRGDLNLKGLKVINACLISGMTGMTTKDSAKKYSFWRIEKGTDLVLENLFIAGERIDCAVDNASGSSPRFIQKNTRTEDGYSVKPYWNNQTNDMIYTNLQGNKIEAPIGGSFFDLHDTTYNKTVRLRQTAPFYFHLQFYDGSQWLDRVKIQLNTGRLFIGSSNSSIMFSPSVPTSGDYVRGDIVYNNGSDNSILLWKRLTTGSNHVLGTDWKALSI